MKSYVCNIFLITQGLGLKGPVFIGAGYCLMLSSLMTKQKVHMLAAGPQFLLHIQFILV